METGNHVQSLRGLTEVCISRPPCSMALLPRAWSYFFNKIILFTTRNISENCLPSWVRAWKQYISIMTRMNIEVDDLKKNKEGLVRIQHWVEAD